jgi:hypothetical protein
MREEIDLEIAGLEQKIFIRKGFPSQCGDIKDGVGLRLEKSVGGFVVSLKKLEDAIAWAKAPQRSGDRGGE